MSVHTLKTVAHFINPASKYIDCPLSLTLPPHGGRGFFQTYFDAGLIIVRNINILIYRLMSFSVFCYRALATFVVT